MVKNRDSCNSPVIVLFVLVIIFIILYFVFRFILPATHPRFEGGLEYFNDLPATHLLTYSAPSGQIRRQVNSNPKKTAVSSPVGEKLSQTQTPQADSHFLER